MGESGLYGEIGSSDSAETAIMPREVREPVRPELPSKRVLEVQKIVENGSSEAFSRWLVNQGQEIISLPYLELPGLIAPGVRLAAADLRGVVFTGGNLSGADLTGANLNGMLATKCNMRGTTFSGAILDAAVLTQADLTSARFVGASLAGAVLTGCDLRGADFTGAYLVGAYLTGCRLLGSKFAAAARSGAYLPPGIMFSEAGIVTGEDDI